jgi:hypothetical protein
MGPWLFLAPALWLALIYLLHASGNPWKAVMGWALLLAPIYIAIGLAEVYARVDGWRRRRRDKR